MSCYSFFFEVSNHFSLLNYRISIHPSSSSSQILSPSSLFCIPCFVGLSCCYYFLCATNFRLSLSLGWGSLQFESLVFSPSWPSILDHNGSPWAYQFFTCYVVTSALIKVLFNFPYDLLWPMSNLEVHSSNSKNLGIFQESHCYWFLIQFHPALRPISVIPVSSSSSRWILWPSIHSRTQRRLSNAEVFLAGSVSCWEPALFSAVKAIAFSSPSVIPSVFVWGLSVCY